ncbi:MAG: hypothetical protein IJN43_15950 [Ruminococcus sp.]|nr:hypothetical protein [Ruminococcus sp.]
MNLHDIFCATSIAGANCGGEGTTREASYSLIEKITVSVSDISMIMRTNEPDGTPYDFKKVMIKLTAPKGGGTAVGQINLNTSCVAMWRNDVIAPDNTRVSIVKASIENGYVNTISLCGQSMAERIIPTYKAEYIFLKMENINSISAFIDSDSIKFPIGTVLEIYAVRN